MKCIGERSSSTRKKPVGAGTSDLFFCHEGKRNYTITKRVAPDYLPLSWCTCRPKTLVYKDGTLCLRRHEICFLIRQDAFSVNSTPTNTARTELHSMITFHHANTRGSRAAKLRIAHHCVLKHNCHPRVMFHSLQHLTLTTSTSSLSPVSSISPTFSDSLTDTHKIYGSRPRYTLRCSTAELRINTNPISQRLRAQIG